MQLKLQLACSEGKLADSNKGTSLINGNVRESRVKEIKAKLDVL